MFECSFIIGIGTREYRFEKKIQEHKCPRSDSTTFKCPRNSEHKCSMFANMFVGPWHWYIQNINFLNLGPSITKSILKFEKKETQNNRSKSDSISEIQIRIAIFRKVPRNSDGAYKHFFGIRFHRPWYSKKGFENTLGVYHGRFEVWTTGCTGTVYDNLGQRSLSDKPVNRYLPYIAFYK